MENQLPNTEASISEFNYTDIIELDLELLVLNLTKFLKKNKNLEQFINKINNF